MAAKEGSFEFDFEAYYTQIDFMKSFSYQLGDERVVEVDFTSIENLTQIDILFDAENQHSIEIQQAGW